MLLHSILSFTPILYPPGLFYSLLFYYSHCDIARNSREKNSPRKVFFSFSAIFFSSPLKFPYLASNFCLQLRQFISLLQKKSNILLLAIISLGFFSILSRSLFRLPLFSFPFIRFLTSLSSLFFFFNFLSSLTFCLKLSRRCRMERVKIDVAVNNKLTNFVKAWKKRKKGKHR